MGFVQQSPRALQRRLLAVPTGIPIMPEATL
jgi:hypothetical protein